MPSCEEPQHRIVLIKTTAIFPAVFTINNFSKRIESNPSYVDEVGVYTFVIESCVSVQFGKQYNCANSTTFNVEILDSCLTTEVIQIVSSPIYKVMQAAQKYDD